MPPVPVAVAVYMVVTAGVTTFVPPLELRVYALPSLPAITTSVASVAATVNVEVTPAAIEDGLAEMLTVGATDVRVAFPPQPANSSGSKRPGIFQE